MKSAEPLNAVIAKVSDVIGFGKPAAHRRILRERSVPTVACGLSDTATISFTSETDDTLMVSLNRELTALSGKIIEPLEIPVEKRGADNYSLMSFTALRLLLDDFDSELGKLI